MLEANGFSAEELWEIQKKKSKKVHQKTSELSRAKAIFGALRDRATSRDKSMFKSFQKMGLDYEGEDPGTLKFAPFYKALQGLYFDRLVSRQEAREIFDLVDRDRSGSISFDELTGAFDLAQGALGKVTNPEVQRENDPRYDAVRAHLGQVVESDDHSGIDMTTKARIKLTDQEMRDQKQAVKRLNELKYRVLDKVTAKAGSKTIRDSLRVAYKEADANGDGNLSYDEFANWLGDGPGGLNLGFTQQDIRDLTLACDRDLDGGIDAIEFIDTMSRKDRPDPRTFLNECRATEVNYMREEQAREVDRLQDRMQAQKFRQHTPAPTPGEISTRVWYSEDFDERVYSKPPKAALNSNTPRLKPLVRAESSQSRPLGATEPEAANASMLMAPDLAQAVAEEKAASARSSHPRQSRQRRVRRNADTFQSTQQLLKTYVYKRTLNPGMVSRLNFEDFGKSMPHKRPDKGGDFRPVWANRLTFDRIGLGGPGVDPKSSHFSNDHERLRDVFLHASGSVNPANKFCLDERETAVARTKQVRGAKRQYLAKRKGQLRKRINHRIDDAESQTLSRIRAKTFQKLRFLEALQLKEEHHVKSTYFTKGLIKSPIAAKNKAGSIMLFRPPSPRGRRVDTLQTGIGTRPEAIVDWMF
jgi:Ca2+-binding EF-hand superfamily protein